MESQNLLDHEGLTMDIVREIARGRVLLRERNAPSPSLPLQDPESVSDSDDTDGSDSEEDPHEDVAYTLERIASCERRIGRLREELRRNTNSVSLIHLEDQKEALLGVLQRKKKLISEVGRLRPQYKPIHGIALRCIFEAAIPPSEYLDPSLSAGPDSYWCQVLRTKKTWTLVCKDWNFIAVSILYHAVVLRHVGQLPAFASSIRSNPALGGLVHSLALAFMVPTVFNSVVTDCVHFILEACTNIRKLYLSSEFLVGCPAGLSLFATPNSGDMAPCIQSTASRLSLLSIHHDLTIHHPKPAFPTSLLLASHNLVTLHIKIPKCPITISDLSLGSLKSLSLMHTDKDHDHCGCIEKVCQWNLPKLDSLTLNWRRELVAVKVGDPLPEQHIFRSHGQRLRYLDLVDVDLHFPVNTRNYVSAIIDLCPMLEHLVCTDDLPRTDIAFILNKCRLPLLFVDVLTTYKSKQRKNLSKLIANRDQSRPHLRWIDRGLYRFASSLPRLIPPDPVGLPPGTCRIHRIFDYMILEARTSLVHHEDDISENLNALMKDLDPRSSTPESDITESDFSDADTYYPDNDEDEDENELETEEQITVEEAIQRFRDTL